MSEAVTQADRETASDLARLAEFINFDGNDAASFKLSIGVWDSEDNEMGEFVRRITRHRIASTADLQARLDAAEGRIAELVEALEDIAGTGHPDVLSHSQQVARKALATARNTEGNEA